MVSYILITGYSILFFMNPLNFVAVILKGLLVNLLAALNFANVFYIYDMTYVRRRLCAFSNEFSVQKAVKAVCSFSLKQF